MSKVGQDIIRGMQEALAHARDERDDFIVHEVELDNIDIKTIRKNLKLTQSELAFMMGVSASGLRKWEQGQRQPRGAARTLLRIMEKEPEAVLRGLSH